MEPLVITVPWDVAKTSLNARLHWQARRRKNDAAKAAARLAYRAAGCPTLDVPVDVVLIARRARSLDADNILSGAKPVADILFGRTRYGEGITPDDSPKWLRWCGIEQEANKRWKGREEVEFVITPREVAADCLPLEWSKS